MGFLSDGYLADGCSKVEPWTNPRTSKLEHILSCCEPYTCDIIRHHAIRNGKVHLSGDATIVSTQSYARCTSAIHLLGIRILLQGLAAHLSCVTIDISPTILLAESLATQYLSGDITEEKMLSSILSRASSVCYYGTLKLFSHVFSLAIDPVAPAALLSVRAHNAKHGLELPPAAMTTIVAIQQGLGTRFNFIYPPYHVTRDMLLSGITLMCSVVSRVSAFDRHSFVLVHMSMYSMVDSVYAKKYVAAIPTTPHVDMRVSLRCKTLSTHAPVIEITGDPASGAAAAESIAAQCVSSGTKTRRCNMTLEEIDAAVSMILGLNAIAMKNHDLIK